jgi:hypothetical protein
MEYLREINHTVCYQWHEALPLSVLIVALLYPLILLAKSYVPVLLGKKVSTKFG